MSKIKTTKKQQVINHFIKHPLSTPKVVSEKFSMALPAVYTLRKQALAQFIEQKNAGELGLDYEPCCKDQTCPKCKPAPVQEPVAQCTVDVSGVAGPSCEPLNWHKAPAQPAPVREDWGPGPHEVHSLPPAAQQEHEPENEPYVSLASVQERTDYAVHLNHCNIGECEGVCKYLDDDCPALEHTDMKAKWDRPTPPAQPAVPDALTSADIQESIEYVAGWNDCRQAMLEMMK